MNRRSAIANAVATIDQAQTRLPHLIPDPVAAYAAAASTTSSMPRTAPNTQRQCSDNSRWRAGDRDEHARAAHNHESRQWRRDLARAELDPIADSLFTALAAGDPLSDAAKRRGTTPARVIGRGTWDETWQQRLDAALMTGRRPDLAHGTERAYRWGRCRCPECRTAKNNRRGSTDSLSKEVDDESQTWRQSSMG